MRGLKRASPRPHPSGRHPTTRTAVRLALIGLTAFERDHFLAGLQGGSDSERVFVLTEDLASSSVALVNANHQPSVDAVLRQRRVASVLILGTAPRPGGRPGCASWPTI